MMTGDRQHIIETNRSLRIIKNELETLLEKGVLTDSAYENITCLLPPESSLSSASVPTLGSLQQQQQQQQHHNQSLHPLQPSLPIRKASPAAEPAANPPPAYTRTQSAAAAVAAPVPSLPPRKNTQPPAAPEKPVLCKARALYKYAAQDSRDCSFDRGDVMHVYEYMNADWWMGRNERTGVEGIFPRTYVEQQQQQVPEHGEEKAGAAAAGGYPAPPPPGAHNGNGNGNKDVPPMAAAEGEKEGEGDGKGQEMGKKFGKKLGNAAIFGAGATVGSKIVSSIF